MNCSQCCAVCEAEKMSKTRAEVLAERLYLVDRQQQMYNGYKSRLRLEMKKWSELRSKAYSMGATFFLALDTSQQRLNFLLLENIAVYQDINRNMKCEIDDAIACMAYPVALYEEEPRVVRVPIHDLEQE